MRRIVIVLAALAAVLAAPAVARAAQCGLPEAKPLWVDFVDGSVPFRSEFARPGVVVGTSGAGIPAAMRQLGAQTVYWEMNLPRYVGAPDAPAPADGVAAAADGLYDRAAASSACGTPVIALNEMLGVTHATPLADPEAQYRANVLAFVQELANRGARTFLLLPSSPNTAGDAAAWWQQTAAAAELVREVYLAAPTVVAQGPVLGSRTLRARYRAAVTALGAIAVPPERIGLMLGFQSGGVYGRAGLQPLPSWLEFVKLATLSAKQVAAELAVGSVWSWGWGTFSAAGSDADKPAAACVYLWTRDQSLCNAPATTQFDTSLTDGQLGALPPGRQCAIGANAIDLATLDQATALLGDRTAAYTALLERAAATTLRPVSRAQILAAEKTLGPRAAYLARLRGAHVTLGFARGVIADQLRLRRLDPNAVLAEEKRELDLAVCAKDELPVAGDVRLASRLPFLARVG
jgi:hypothetical protein